MSINELAEMVFTASWWGLVFGAALTLISTLAAFWSSGIRDEASSKKIYHLEQKTAWRQLTDRQSNAIIDFAKAKKPTIAFLVISGDAEIYLLTRFR